VTSPNEEIARRGYEAIVNGDLDAVREFLDPDVKWHGGDPDWTGACRNRDEALVFMRRAAKNNRIGELVDTRAFGDKVVIVMRPRPGPGEEPRLTANVTTFRDGRAIEIVHYPDPQAALAAASAAD
jgi:ketosteroid isomerase-like protein